MFTEPVHPQFGAVLSAHRAGGTRYWRGLAWVFAVAAFALAGFVDELLDSNPAAAIAPGLAVAILGLVLWVMSGRRVVVYAHGIERRGRLGRERLAWHQLQDYTLNVSDPSPLGVDESGMISGRFRWMMTGEKIAPQSVVLRGKGGEMLTIPSRLQDYDALLAALIPSLTAHIAARVNQQLSTGSAVTFGNRLAVDPQTGVVFTELLGRKQTLPFDEVESVVFQRGYVAIRRHGDTRPWQTVAIAVVPNVVAFKEVVTQLSPPRLTPPSGDQYDWAL